MIVATVGRIVDLMDKGVAKLDQCSILVMDEADKLLSMDNSNSLETLLAYLPKDKQTLLYSATFPVTVQGFMVSVRLLRSMYTHTKACLTSHNLVRLVQIPV